MKIQGKIVTWKDQEGFGFIMPTDGGLEVFAHISAFISPSRRPQVNDEVSYTLATDPNGRPRALQVSLDEDSSMFGALSRDIVIAILVGLIFLAGVATAVGIEILPRAVLGLYILISIVTFLIYGADKAAASAGRWRISENGLHLLSLLGGWPGALVGQRVFRHKSRKLSFQFVFWVTVGINVLSLGWKVHQSW